MQNNVEFSVCFRSCLSLTGKCSYFVPLRIKMKTFLELARFCHKLLSRDKTEINIRFYMFGEGCYNFVIFFKFGVPFALGFFIGSWKSTETWRMKSCFPRAISSKNIISFSGRNLQVSSYHPIINYSIRQFLLCILPGYLLSQVVIVVFCIFLAYCVILPIMEKVPSVFLYPVEVFL